MTRPTSVVNLDPIDRARKKGFLSRLLVTRWYPGHSIKRMQPFGHYMFCGPQGSSKSVSMIWYAEYLTRRYETPSLLRRTFARATPRRVHLYSNIGIGSPFKKTDLANLIDSFDPYSSDIRIVLVDEIHTYFPRDGSSDRASSQLRSDLISIFSQLRKRNTFVLSTAQVYGRLHKSLREQCLYMINCSVTWRNLLKNEFIPGDDIICDELGRWAGNPKFIRIHGLPSMKYDTKLVIRD